MTGHTAPTAPSSGYGARVVSIDTPKPPQSSGTGWTTGGKTLTRRSPQLLWATR